MDDIQNFGDMHIAEEHKQHQRDVQDFLNAYIEVLRIIGDGESLVNQMQMEVKYLTRQGAELGEALMDHYMMTKKKYGI